MRTPPDKPEVLPEAVEVERLAVAMAAGLGHAWANAHPDFRDTMRRAANAALTHYGADLHIWGRGRLSGLLAACTAALRDAARRFEGPGEENEELLQELYRTATEADRAKEAVGSSTPISADEPEEAV